MALKKRGPSRMPALPILNGGAVHVRTSRNVRVEKYLNFETSYLRVSPEVHCIGVF